MQSVRGCLELMERGFKDFGEQVWCGGVLSMSPCKIMH